MAKKLGSAGLALSVLLAVFSLLVKGGIGVSLADGVNVDFNIISAKAEITHETAICLNDSLNESFNITGGTGATETISCVSPFSFSDSFEILANLAILRSEFFTDLNETIYAVLTAGTCAQQQNSSGFVIPIPGSDLHKVTNKNGTMYTFEGNVPGFPIGGLVVGAFGSGIFDHVELNIKVPTTGTPTLALEGNANLCRINGPMALGIFLGEGNDGDSDLDSDTACINIPAPEFETLDVSQVVPDFFCGIKF